MANGMVLSTLEKNIGAIAAGAGGLAIGSAVGYVAGRRTTRKKKRKSTSTRKSKRKGTSKRRNTKYARTAGKQKDRSKRRIRMTKNGQPYVILASGKARFISKRSAKLSRRRKGGRY